MSIESGASLRASGLRDTRFGEIVVVRIEADRVRTSVYSTVGLNNCPVRQWRSLDPATIARELGAHFVDLKGPQFWAIDEIDVRGVGEAVSVGGLDARLISDTSAPHGTLPDANLTPGCYEGTVVRQHETEWKLYSGRPLYRLLCPAGQQYYLLAYGHSIDCRLSSHSLMTLGGRLRLPGGWRYIVGSPAKDLVLRADGGQARMLTDDLDNIYLHRTRASSTPDQEPPSVTANRTAVQAALSGLSRRDDTIPEIRAPQFQRLSGRVAGQAGRHPL